MNNILAEANTASVRAYNDTKLGSHEQHTQHLRHTSQATRVNLANVNSVCLEQLLEDNAVVCMLPCGDSNTVRFQTLTDSCMAEDVVRCCRGL